MLWPGSFPAPQQSFPRKDVALLLLPHHQTAKVNSPFSVGSLVEENRLLLKVPDRCKMGTLSAENDIVVFVCTKRAGRPN